MFQEVINETVHHRDAGLGDTWRCPLPNGYALMMIDVTDQGWVPTPDCCDLSTGMVDNTRAANARDGYITLKKSGSTACTAKALLPPKARPNFIYRSSSITCSSTSLPGRTADSGSVARGSSVMFRRSTKVGVLELT